MVSRVQCHLPPSGLETVLSELGCFHYITTRCSHPSSGSISRVRYDPEATVCEHIPSFLKYGFYMMSTSYPRNRHVILLSWWHFKVSNKMITLKYSKWLGVIFETASCNVLHKSDDITRSSAYGRFLWPYIYKEYNDVSNAENLPKTYIFIDSIWWMLYQFLEYDNIFLFTHDSGRNN